MAHTFPKTRCEICGKPAHEWLHKGQVGRQHKIALKALRWNRQRQGGIISTWSECHTRGAGLSALILTACLLTLGTMTGCGSTTPLSTFEKPPVKMSQADSLYHANQIRVLTDQLYGR